MVVVVARLLARSCLVCRRFLVCHLLLVVLVCVLVLQRGHLGLVLALLGHHQIVGELAVGILRVLVEPRVRRASKQGRIGLTHHGVQFFALSRQETRHETGAKGQAVARVGRVRVVVLVGARLPAAELRRRVVLLDRAIRWLAEGGRDLGPSAPVARLNHIDVALTLARDRAGALTLVPVLAAGARLAAELDRVRVVGQREVGPSGVVLDHGHRD